MSRFEGRSPGMVRKSGGDNAWPENVIGIIQEFHIKNARGDTFFDYAEKTEGDYVTIGLLQDAFDLKAAEGGVIPSVSVKVTVRKPKIEAPKPGEKQKAGPRTVYGMTRRAGSGPALQPGDIVAFWGCYKNRDGMISAAGANAIAYKGEMEGDHPRAHVLPQMSICVTDAKGGNNGKPWQKAYALDNMVSPQVLSQVNEAGKPLIPELRKAITALVNTPAPCEHAFAVIARKMGSEAEMPAIAANITSRLASMGIASKKKVENSENERIPPTPDEVFDNFMKYARPELVQILNGEVGGYQVEFVPGISTSQSAGITPGSKYNEHDTDLSKPHRVFDEEGSGVTITDYGYADGTIVLKRVSEEDVTAPYFASVEILAKKSPAVVTVDDLITPNMHPAHLAAVQQSADYNTKLREKFYKALKGEQQQAQVPELANDIPF